MEKILREEKLTRLFTILEEEVKIVRNLISISEKQGEELKKNKDDKLIEIISEQEKLVGVFTKLEAERVSLVKELLPEGEQTLSALNDIAFEQKGSLLNLGEELKAELLRLKEINELNAFLLHQTLSYMDKILSLTGLKQTRARTYSRKGEIHLNNAKQINLDKNI